jgi:hypothetical protein
MKLIPTQNRDMYYIENIILNCLKIGIIPYIENALWVCNANSANIVFKAWIINGNRSGRYLEICSEHLWNSNKDYVFIKADSLVIDTSLIKNYSQGDYFISLLHKDIRNDTFKKRFIIETESADPVISIKLNYNIFYKNNTISDIENMSPVNPDNTGVSFDTKTTF